MANSDHFRLVGAPAGIRTQTEAILSRVPLPIGTRGRGSREGYSRQVGATVEPITRTRTGSPASRSATYRSPTNGDRPGKSNPGRTPPIATVTSAETAS